MRTSRARWLGRLALAGCAGWGAVGTIWLVDTPEPVYCLGPRLLGIQTRPSPATQGRHRLQLLQRRGTQRVKKENPIYCGYQSLTTPDCTRNAAATRIS